VFVLQIDADYHNYVLTIMRQVQVVFYVETTARLKSCLLDVLPASLLIGRVLSANWVTQDTDVGKLFPMSGLTLPVYELCQSEMRSVI
jgi:hypothetical protein